MADAPTAVLVPTASAWYSKINWTQAVSGFAIVLTWVSGGKVGLTAEQQAAICTVIALICNVATWVQRTWFTKTVTPASITR